MSFEGLQKILAPVADLPCLWFVGGGWAIDLFVGRETRPHGDIDICVFRDDQHILQSHFAGWDLSYIENSAAKPWPADMHISLPQHEVWAKRDEEALEFLLSEHDGGNWVSRRDNRIRLPLLQAVRVNRATGIRFLAPQAMLLFKSKAARDKDTADFNACWPMMSAVQQAWLRTHLGDEHPWMARL